MFYVKNKTDLEKEDHALTNEFVLNNLIQDRIDQQKSTYVSFIDLEKAFYWIYRDFFAL